MKRMITLTLFSLLSAQSLFAIDDFDYASLSKAYLDKMENCRYAFVGCTDEEKLSMLLSRGDILGADQFLDLTIEDIGSPHSLFIPLELSDKELLTLAATTSLGIIAFKNDQEITNTITAHRSHLTEQISNVGNFLGSGAILPIAAGSYFLGVLYQDNKLKRVGLFTVGASIASAIATTVVKNTFERVRPNENRGPYNFFEKGNASFYSGHTAEAFTLATVISEMYKEDYPIIPWISYGLASITAYARVHDKAHWASDVIIGAAAGHLITKLALSSMNHDTNRGGLEIYPTFDPMTGTAMINFEYTERMPETPLKCNRIKDENARNRACMTEVFDRAFNKKKR